MPPKFASIALTSPQTPTHTSISLPDITTWMSNKHLKLTLSKPETPGFPSPFLFYLLLFPVLAEGNSIFPVVQAKNVCIYFWLSPLTCHIYFISWFCWKKSRIGPNNLSDHVSLSLLLPPPLSLLYQPPNWYLCFCPNPLRSTPNIATRLMLLTNSHQFLTLLCLALSKCLK